MVLYHFNFAIFQLKVTYKAVSSHIHKMELSVRQSESSLCMEKQLKPNLLIFFLLSVFHHVLSSFTCSDFHFSGREPEGKQ